MRIVVLVYFEKYVVMCKDWNRIFLVLFLIKKDRRGVGAKGKVLKQESREKQKFVSDIHEFENLDTVREKFCFGSGSEDEISDKIRIRERKGEVGSGKNCIA